MTSRGIVVVVVASVVALACRPGDEPTRDDETGSGDDASTASDATTSTVQTTGDAADESGSSGDEPASPDLLEPWAEVVDEPFDLMLGEVGTVYEPPADFELGSFPVAVDVPRGPGTRVLVSFSETPDVASAAPNPRTFWTDDGGASFEPAAPMGVTNAAQLLDGTLLDVGFIPSWAIGDTVATLAVSRSDDGGASWASEEGTFDAGEAIRGLRVHRGMQQVHRGPDAGTILIAYYGLFGDDDTRTIGLAASTDGSSWTRWGTILPPNDPVLTYDETSFAYTGRGSIVAVTRAYVDGTLGPLLVCRSDDDGRTFSAPEPLQLTFPGQEPAARVGVDPGLTLLPNGLLALVGGRPDNWLAVSADGGLTWPQARITYVNHPTQNPNHGSSGYQAITATSSHRALLVGDNCANSWGCPASDSGWTIDGEYRIWRRRVDAVPLDPGRIDLATALARGDVTVETELVSDGAARGAGVLFDGNVQPGSVLRGEGTTRIVLGAPTEVTRLGIAGAPGTTPASVRLYDGTQWIDPLISTSVGGDRRLVAWMPSSPRTITELEVTTGAGGGLAEVELFSSVDSFENEALGQPPRAAREASLAQVVAREGEASRQMLRLYDAADDAIASVVFDVDAATAVGFRVRPLALPGAMLLGMEDAAGARVHLAVDARGGVRQYDGGTEAWTDVAPAGTVDTTTWFDVSLSSSEVVLGGASILVAIPPGFDPTGVYVTSTGTVPVGVDLLIDDLVRTL